MQYRLIHKGNDLKLRISPYLTAHTYAIQDAAYCAIVSSLQHWYNRPEHKQYKNAMNNQHPVVHFEMPYEDADRIIEFYEKAFDWKMNRYGEDMGNYITAHTAETDENNMVKTPGTINGGFYPKRPDAPQPCVVVSVDDIQNAMKKVIEAGGTVFGEPMDIPGVGLYVAFSDTEGNYASMLQPKM